MMHAHNPPHHIVFHGGGMETILMEVELGEVAAFALYHSDDIMFGDWF